LKPLPTGARVQDAPQGAVVPCAVHLLGLVDYGEAYQLQLDLCGRRLSGAIPDTLLLLEHPPTVTIGKTGRLESVLVSQEELRAAGVALFFTDRGGDATYHGPGQLVVYPIVDLREHGRDVHAYVHGLEEVVIRALSRLGVASCRQSHSGVWVEQKQIAAIGIAIKRGITMHGIALNVKPQEAYFRLINPCGMAGVPVTSVESLTGRTVSLEEVAAIVAEEFGAVFGVRTFDGGYLESASHSGAGASCD
jgi:lipoate-protein ligase B